MYKFIIIYLITAFYWVKGQDVTPFYKLTSAGSCQGAKPRPNFYEMTDQDWKKYANAIKELNKGPRPTRWDQLSLLHKEIYDSIHFTNSFLAWHRAFLYVLEKELQLIDKDVMIPFWDWTVYSQIPEEDPILKDERFGGAGDPNNNFRIVNGTFKDFEVLYGGPENGKPHKLGRGFIQYKDRISPRLSPDAIKGVVMGAEGFKDFANLLEPVPHGMIHNAIGEDFAGHASPSDPLFYSHHAFVDKLWYNWQMTDESHMNQYSFDNTIPSLDSKLNSFNITLAEVLDIKKNLCYYYPEDDFTHKKSKTQRRAVDSNVWDVYRRAKELSVISPLDTYVEMECDSKEDLKQHDLDYIMKGVLAPGPYDRTDMNKLRIPEPLPEEFLNRMGYPISLVRQIERKFALFTNALNRNDNFVSSSALVNRKNFPKLKKKCKAKHL